MPWKYIISGIGALALLAGVYFVVQSYNKTMKENAALTIQNKTLTVQKEELEKNYQAITDTLNKNDEQTRVIEEHTHTIEREIRSTPITTNCVQSPAIQKALEGITE